MPNMYITISKIVLNFDLSLNYFDLSNISTIVGASWLDFLSLHRIQFVFGRTLWSLVWSVNRQKNLKNLSCEKNWHFMEYKKLNQNWFLKPLESSKVHMISLSSFILLLYLQLLSNWIWSEIITNSVPHVTQILPIFQFKRHVWSENRSSLISYKHLKITIV